MLPPTTGKDDAEHNVRDGNTKVRNGWLNKLQRDVTARKASESGGTFPDVAGSTEPWGGGHLVVFKCPAGVSNADKQLIDDSIDWRNRVVVILSYGVHTGAGGGLKLPGEGGEEDAQPGFDLTPAEHEFYTGAGGTTHPPGAGELKCAVSASVYLYCDTAGDLYLYNAYGADFFPWLVLLVLDQFPTRT
jgi:hypothetical protein